MSLPPAPRFCQFCGGPLSPSLPPGAPLACTACGQGVYLDPKVAVAAVVRREGRVLLLQRSQRDSAHGRWILPGGHVDRGEEATAAAAREVAEETGLAVEVEGLLGVYSYPGNPVVLIVYLARPVGGSLRPGAEALKLREFAPEEVPWDSLGFDSTRDALRDLWGPACPA